MGDKNKKLYYLDELSDYKVADNYCDVRGWEVKDANNRTIGKVDNLLVNKEAQRVLYLDAELDKSVMEDGYETSDASDGNKVYEFLSNDGDNHIIIPVAMARLDEKNKKVICNDIHYKTFTKIARFCKGTDIDDVYELTVLRHYVPDKERDDNIL